MREEHAAAARAGRGGIDLATRYASFVDAIVRETAEASGRHTTTPWAVCAIGGYGRRALCLHSDVDLLILLDGRLGPPEEQFVTALLQPLWDLRLTIGHQVRHLRELDAMDGSNPEFLLALLDARLVAGDERVFAKGRARFPGAKGSCARGLLQALLSLTAERHAAFNHTFHQLEPDIKESPGALRDISTVRWILALGGHVPSGSAVDLGGLDDAEDFLLRIRSILHVECGRNRNVLTHALQERVADALDAAGVTTHARVESLMRGYFRGARTVARALAAAMGAENLPRDGFDFDAWASAFEDPRRRGKRVQALRALLHPRPGLYARLSHMHETGALARVLPEFALIECRVIRDFYHRYTVDEHTLLAVRNIESLLECTAPGRQRFAALLRELRDPTLLILALLLHDVGKSADDGDHVAESLRLARTALNRLGLPRRARDTVEFLIGNHLQMSLLAFRRDAEDPQVIRRFAALVGTEERLKLLCLMTLADVEAVAPGTLTPWKEDLLWRLYVDTYNDLTLAYGDELIEQDQTALAALRAAQPADVHDAELSRFLRGLPRQYLALFDPPRIYRHVRLARDIHPDEVHAFVEHIDANWVLTVVAADKPYLFSNISGVLAYFGMGILRGHAMTTAEGLAVDVFEFTDTERFLARNPGAAAKICGLLQEVVAGRADVTRLLRGRARSALHQPARRTTPVVHFDDLHSHRYTVIEIVADDAVGLLYRLSRAMSAHGCDVHLVLISTQGDLAVDVFHVTSGGAKLSPPEQLVLKQTLEHLLEHRHETD